MESDVIKAENGETVDGTCNETEYIEIVIATSDFAQNGKDQLSFTQGQQIKIIHKNNANWWWAELDGYYGYVPVNHVASMQCVQQVAWQDEEYFGNYSNLKLHHEMLSDQSRTMAYMNAVIKNAEQLEGKVVLDVGCGTGILSMICAKHAQPQKVYAVEASSMAVHTREVVRQNNLSNVIEVVQGYAEEVEIEQEVDLIISEWMGTILVFEMMIESVIIMRNKFLKDSGTIWPSAASLFLVPCSAHSHYSDKVEFWDSQFGFDFSYLKNCAKEDILCKPFHDYVLPAEDCLSDAQRILSLDMKSVTVDDLEDNSSSFSFIINKGTLLHGFGCWFEAEFCPLGDDADGREVILNTGPYHELTHWKQNLFLLDEPISVCQGSVVEGTVRVYRNPEWRRHLRMHLQFSVTATAQSDSQVHLRMHLQFSVTATAQSDSQVTHCDKLFYIWR